MKKFHELCSLCMICMFIADCQGMLTNQPEEEEPPRPESAFMVDESNGVFNLPIDDAGEHSLAGKDEACFLRQLSVIFKPKYVPYYDRVVIDISYPQLLACLRERYDGCVEINQSNPFTKAPDQNLVELFREIDSPEKEGAILAEIKNKLFDIAPEDKEKIGNLLDIVWKNPTGKQRLKALFLLKKSSSLSRACNWNMKLKITFPTTPPLNANFKAVDRTVELRPDSTAATLTHELSHAYHHFLFSFWNISNGILTDNTYITRSDPKLNKVIFPLDNFATIIPEEIANEMKHLVSAFNRAHGLDASDKIVNKIVQIALSLLGKNSHNHKWTNLEEMLTIAGIAFFDISPSVSKDKVYHYMITDRQNEGMFARREGEQPTIYHKDPFESLSIINSIQKAYCDVLSKTLYDNDGAFDAAFDAIKAHFMPIVQMIAPITGVDNNGVTRNAVRSNEQKQLGDEAANALIRGSLIASEEVKMESENEYTEPTSYIPKNQLYHLQQIQHELSVEDDSDLDSTCSDLSSQSEWKEEEKEFESDPKKK